MDITGFSEQIRAAAAPIVNQITKKSANKAVQMIPKSGLLKSLVMANQAMPVKSAVMPKTAMPVKSLPIPKANMPIKSIVMPKETMPVKSVLMPKAAMPVKSLPMPKAAMPIKSAVMPKTITPQKFRQLQVAQAFKQKFPKASAIVKNTCQIVPISKLTQTTEPAEVLAANPVQRSYMPVDLPYQTIKSKSPRVKLKNTPFSYSADIDMIEPPVDSGISDYYGK